MLDDAAAMTVDYMVYFLIDAMLRNETCVRILGDRSFERCPILIMYVHKEVMLDHLPIFMMVVSLSPYNCKDIAPQAQRECTPTRSGLIPVFSSFRVQIAVSIAVMRSSGMTITNLCFSLMNLHKYDDDDKIMIHDES